MSKSSSVGWLSAWEILGVPPNSSTDVVRAAYLRRALEAHPDKGGTKEAFQAVAAAFEELCARVSVVVVAAGQSAPDEGEHGQNSQKPKEQQKTRRNNPEKKGAVPSKKAAAAKHGATGRPASPSPAAHGEHPSSSSSGGQSEKQTAGSAGSHFAERLRALLQLLAPSARKRIIMQDCSPSQRRELERWMQERKQHCARTPPTREILLSLCAATEDRGSFDCRPVASDEHQQERRGGGDAEESASCSRHGVPTSVNPMDETFDGSAGRPHGTGRGVKTSHMPRDKLPLYRGFVCLRKVQMYGPIRRELSEAIADHIILVNIKARANSASSCGSLYRDRLPLAIRAVSQEHAVSHDAWKICFHFDLPFWGVPRLTTPIQHWELALRAGLYLMEILPFNGRVGGGPFLVKYALTPETAEDLWSRFSDRYVQVCVDAGRDESTVRSKLATTVERYGVRKRSAVMKWHAICLSRQKKVEAKRLAQERRQERAKARIKKRQVHIIYLGIRRVLRGWLQEERQQRKRDARAKARQRYVARLQEAQRARLEAKNCKLQERAQLAAEKARSRMLKRRLQAERGMTMDEILRPKHRGPSPERQCG